jgi:peptidoglycan/LPS O-acetylase OafA/YrhL
LLREARRIGTINLMDFYARRTRRLLPALALVLLATTLVGAVVYAPIEQEGLANTALATAAYVSNLYFAGASTDYLAARAVDNPLLHTWSLSVEEQFYVVWPLLLTFVVGARARRRPDQASPRILPWMLSIILASFALSIYLTRTQQPWAFFLSPSRAWEFAAGALAALPGQRKETLAFWKPAWGWAGLAGILLAATTFDATTSFPGVAALLPAGATALLLRAGSTAPNRGVANLLGLPVFQFLGRLSYSWYLWHWPVLVLAAAVKGSLALHERLILAGLSLTLAYVSFKFVESPIRHSPSLVARPYASLAAAAVITVFGVSLSLGWITMASHWTTSPNQARYRPIRVDLPAIYRMGCDEYFHSAAAKECVFGTPNATQTVVLFGDSHAGQWFPAVDRMVAARGWRLVVLTKSACPAVDAPFFFADIGRVYTECQEWLRTSLARIHEIHPALVLVAYSKEYPFSPEAWQTGIDRVMESLSRSSGHVLVIRDTPRLRFDALSCLARLDWQPAFLQGAETCQMGLGDAASDSLYSLQAKTALHYGNVLTIDMTNYICPNGTCRVVQDGIVTYRDAHHITRQFAEALTDGLGQQVDLKLQQRP